MGIESHLGSEPRRRRAVEALLAATLIFLPAPLALAPPAPRPYPLVEIWDELPADLDRLIRSLRGMP